MQLNIFNIPVFIENIDCNKLKFNEALFQETWESKTQSTFESGNHFLNKESSDYLLSIIAEMLYPELKKKFTINLQRIWINRYSKNDYQEEHTHKLSHFSFIIYSKVEQSNTVFLSAYREIVEAYDMSELFETKYQFPCRSNQIILFPSFLRHRVKKLNCDYETISGNITLNFN
jgi:hypothetical protein